MFFLGKGITPTGFSGEEHHLQTDNLSPFLKKTKPKPNFVPPHIPSGSKWRDCQKNLEHDKPFPEPVENNEDFIHWK